HPLTQAVAYDTQLRERRGKIHAQVASVVEELFGEKLDEQAALLASHWAEADEPGTAVRWPRRAADWAGLNDAAEAHRHWERVRDLVSEIPENPEILELGARACSQILMLGWRIGESEEDAAANFERGKALAERSGSIATLAELNGNYAAIRGLNLGYVPDYLAHADEATRLADQTNDAALQCAERAYRMFANIFAGNHPEVLALTDELAGRIPDDPNFGVEFTGFSPLLGIPCARGWSLLSMGRFDEALEGGEEMLRATAAHGFPEMEVWARVFMAWVGEINGDNDLLRSHSHAALDAAEKLGGGFDRLMAYSAIGAAHMVDGELDAAIEALENSLRIAAETRSGGCWTPLTLGFLAEAHLRQGSIAPALERAQEAVSFASAHALRLFPRAWLALARAQIRSDLTAEALETLKEAQQVIDDTSSAGYQPRLWEYRAELAQRQGDADAHAHAMREALRLYRELGATGHTERLTQSLNETS
ncbi:MAG: hypothetical protein O7G84_11070, partial [Gammaproteobacteria bacterium]|nr:hypothetical protein [Gammaproteobacteria bacterium]